MSLERDWTLFPDQVVEGTATLLLFTASLAKCACLHCSFSRLQKCGNVKVMRPFSSGWSCSTLPNKAAGAVNNSLLTERLHYTVVGSQAAIRADQILAPLSRQPWSWLGFVRISSQSEKIHSKYEGRETQNQEKRKRRNHKRRANCLVAWFLMFQRIFTHMIAYGCYGEGMPHFVHNYSLF